MMCIIIMGVCMSGYELINVCVNFSYAWDLKKYACMNYYGRVDV